VAESDRLTIKIRPQKHLYEYGVASLHGPQGFMNWRSMNVDVDRERIVKRCGYSSALTLMASDKPLNSYSFVQEDGTKKMVVLTETDILTKETTSGYTYSYRTPVQLFATTEQVDSITSATVVFEAGTTIKADGLIAAGDYFVLDEDLTATNEPDTSWRVISSLTNETTMVLTAAYQKNVASPGAKDAQVRTIYSVPSNEKWNAAVVNDIFCFTNGNINTQQWDGTATKALDLNATYAKKARYCVPFVNRLILADVEEQGGSDRNPWRILYSANNDPTDYSSTDAGAIDLIDTMDTITGLAVVGGQLIVFKQNSYYIGTRTGVALDPIKIASHKRGVGCIAPYSIVHVEGTVAWLSRDNFYMMEGSAAKPIGNAIKDLVFEICTDDALTQIWGFWVPEMNKVIWLLNTKTDGQVAVAWDYIREEMGTYKFWDTVYGTGWG